MGQENIKGNRATRVAKALEKIEALKPDHIVCNNCQAHLTDIVKLDSHQMEGIEAAFAARCELCDQDTWALKGGKDTVADEFTAIDGDTDGADKIGVTTKPRK